MTSTNTNTWILVFSKGPAEHCMKTTSELRPLCPWQWVVLILGFHCRFVDHIAMMYRHGGWGGVVGGGRCTDKCWKLQQSIISTSGVTSHFVLMKTNLRRGMVTTCCVTSQRQVMLGRRSAPSPDSCSDSPGLHSVYLWVLWFRPATC